MRCSDEATGTLKRRLPVAGIAGDEHEVSVLGLREREGGHDLERSCFRWQVLTPAAGDHVFVGNVGSDVERVSFFAHEPAKPSVYLGWSPPGERVPLFV